MKNLIIVALALLSFNAQAFQYTNDQLHEIAGHAVKSYLYVCRDGSDGLAFVVHLGSKLSPPDEIKLQCHYLKTEWTLNNKQGE